MSRLTSEERRRIFLLQEQAGQRMLAPLLVSTAAIDRGRDRCRRLQDLTRAVFSLALATAGLLLCAFVEFHAPASLVDALLPRW
jgi:hypothetical protein